MKIRRSEKGFTLAELMVGVAVTAMGAAAGSALLRDYFATARTLRVQAAANSDMITLTRDIVRDFQTSTRTRRRACVLQRVAGDVRDPVQQLANFQCQANDFGPTDGIGFEIPDVGNLTPAWAYINACIPYTDDQLPRGRGNVRHIPPDPPSRLNWGGASNICPAACPRNFRPVIQYIANGDRMLPQKQVPPPTTNANLSMWGAVMCASRFTDLRQLQNLNGTAFVGDYINVLLFIARARYDVLFPQVQRADGTNTIQSYVWMTGGVSLDFLDSQEMSIFKCPPPRAGVVPPPGC